MGAVNRRLLDRIPCFAAVGTETEGLWRLVLVEHGVWLPPSLEVWKTTLDYGKAPQGATLFMNPTLAERGELMGIYGFPELSFPLEPSDDELDHSLARVFLHLPMKHGGLLRQSDIANEIASRVELAKPDVVAVLIFDGLAFGDTSSWRFSDLPFRREPVIVDGLTITEAGMRRVVGDPPLAHKLFVFGYRTRLGFSYWGRRGNPLARDLFAEFPERQLHRVDDFAKVLGYLQTANLVSGMFVQIIRTGLDHICHLHRERPNVGSMIDEMQHDVESLAKILIATGLSFQLFVTSDHGILWHHNQRVVPFEPVGHRPRYQEGSVNSTAAHLIIEEEGVPYTVLCGGDIIARTCRTTEWGFHGGISARESLVPLLEIRTSSLPATR